MLMTLIFMWMMLHFISFLSHHVFIHTWHLLFSGLILQMPIRNASVGLASQVIQMISYGALKVLPLLVCLQQTVCAEAWALLGELSFIHVLNSSSHLATPNYLSYG